MTEAFEAVDSFLEEAIMEYPESIREPLRRYEAMMVSFNHYLAAEFRGSDIEVANELLTGLADWIEACARHKVSSLLEDNHRLVFDEATELLRHIPRAMEHDDFPGASLAMFSLGQKVTELHEPINESLRQANNRKDTSTAWRDEVREIVAGLRGNRSFEAVFSEIEQRSYWSDGTCFTSVNHEFRVINWRTAEGKSRDFLFNTLQDFLRRKKNFL
jgi:hypothetical protein